MSRSANLASFAKAIDGSAPFNINGTLTVNNVITPINFTANTLTLNNFVTNTISFSTSLAFSNTAGTEYVRISSNGNVGIGTTSPVGKLHIYNSTGNSPAILNINSVNGGGGTTGIYFRPYQSDTQAASNPAQAAIYAIDNNYSADITFNTKTTGAIGNALVERMRIDASGNVGIGTSSPANRLTIATGAPDRIGVVFSNDAKSTINFGSPTVGDGNFQLQYDRALGAFIFNGGSTGSQTERMRIDYLGQLGIGTTSAIATLDVNGEMRTASSANWNYAALNVVRKASNTSTPRMISMALGGDDSASTTIGAYNAIWGIYNAAPSAASTSSALQGEMAFASFYGYRWYINGNERMRIDSNGKVVIGSTTTGQQLLTIRSGGGETGIVISETSTNGKTYELIAGGTAGSFSGGAFGIYDRSAGAVRMLVQSDGLIQHGDTYSFRQKCYYNRGWDNYPSITVDNDTTIGPCSEFRVHGAGGASGGDFSVNFRIDGGSYFTSDARIKVNVENITYGLEDINKLRPVTYKRINSEGKIENPDGKKLAGFIAQEVNEVIPEAVNYYPDEDKPNEIGWARAYALNNDVILTAAVKAIQELSAKVDALQARIVELEKV